MCEKSRSRVNSIAVRRRLITSSTVMNINRDTLNARWEAIETRLVQIAAAPGLDRELCRAEAERLLAEQDQIEYVLGLHRPSNGELPLSSGTR